MQLLVVHQDAEVGEQLVQMVKDYTPHDCALAMSDAAALMWAKAHHDCAVLIAQLEGDETNALKLGSDLSGIFPGLQTLFLPGYAASEQRFEIANTKVFPEPIDGELLLSAIEHAATVPFGAPDLFHVLDVLQMCCLSGRSGAVQIVKGNSSGIVFLRDGRIVHAETAAARGTGALFDIAGWSEIEFAYDPSVRTPETISLPWDEALIEAVTKQKTPTIAATQKIVLDDAPPLSSPSPSRVAPLRRLFAGLRRR